MGSNLNVRSWVGFLLGQLEITCWLEVVEWWITGLPYAWISLLSVSIAAILHKVAVKLRHRDMWSDCVQRRSTYGVFAILVQTVKMRMNHQKLWVQLMFFCLQSLCNLLTWQQVIHAVSKNNWISAAVHNISVCLNNFVLWCLAKRYTIQRVFKIKSSIRNKT
jgi:hypothetical protein